MLDSFDRIARRLQDVELHYFPFDDCSTDNTYEILKLYVPESNISIGDGNYFWNKGMITSYELANSSDVFHGYLILNDDVEFCEEGTIRFFEFLYKQNFQDVLIGSCKDKQTNQITYGGRTRNKRLNRLSFSLLSECGNLQTADTFNGNFVYLPRHILEKVGFLDDSFTHGIGDYDLGLRIAAQNYKLLVSPGVIGYCSRNLPEVPWLSSEISFSQRWHILHSPKGPPPLQMAKYAWKHQKLTALKYLLSPYLRISLTLLWR